MQSGSSTVHWPDWPVADDKALTGFLCIADGLPDVPPSMNAEAGPNSNQTINQGLHARTVCRCRCLGLDYSLLLTRELCSSKGFSLLILFKSSGQEMLQTMDLPDSGAPNAI